MESPVNISNPRNPLTKTSNFWDHLPDGLESFCCVKTIKDLIVFYLKELQFLFNRNAEKLPYTKFIQINNIVS